jgi:hypothetical protein
METAKNENSDQKKESRIVAAESILSVTKTVKKQDKSGTCLSLAAKPLGRRLISDWSLA